jgi:plasmid stabilization system protein ParE
MNARFTADARTDLADAVRYYERQRAGLGRDFRTEVAETIERIKSVPDVSRAIVGDVHRRRMERFPYGIFYRTRGDELLIFAIVHLKRDSRSWRDRL